MSRDPYCTCPSCLGTQVADAPCFRTRVTPADFGASKPVVFKRGYIKPSTAPMWDCPKVPAEFVADVAAGYSAQRAAFQELLQKTRREHEELRETVLLKALGMTAQEALDNRHRITRHQYPDKDVFLLDGEPVVEIHKPVIRGDELVTRHRNLRTDRGVSYEHSYSQD